MPESTDTVFSNKEKIQILFKEYETLRAEIVARTSGGFQVLIVGGAVTTWLLARTSNGSFWFLVIAFTSAFAFIAYSLFRDCARIAARLQQLESRINQLAGENLLEWESRWGGLADGRWGMLVARYYRRVQNRKLPPPAPGSGTTA
jgi:hypothetical protein